MGIGWGRAFGWGWDAWGWGWGWDADGDVDEDGMGMWMGMGTGCGLGMGRICVRQRLVQRSKERRVFDQVGGEPRPICRVMCHASGLPLKHL